MPALTMSPTLGDLLKYELDRNVQRETVTLAQGTSFKLGAVLGRITKGAVSSAAKAGGNTGNGTLTLANPAADATAKPGVYKVRCFQTAVNGGTFTVIDPDGLQIGVALVGQQFANGVIFTVADGATDFVVGDGFDVTVAAGSGKYRLSPASDVDGSDKAAAVLLEDKDATAADKTVVVLVRGPAVLSKATLVFDASVDQAAEKAAKHAQLADAGIVPRETA